MQGPFKFSAVAYFAKPIAGRRRAATTDQGIESVYAETPEAAARMWLWRLSADERAVVDRVIVWPPKPHLVIATYDGPTIVYRRVDGRLVEIDRRPPA
jgi:hypothetical protein